MHLTLGSYILGFALSLLFTLVPYVLVSQQLADRVVLILGISLAAIIQLVIQLKFFLHLSFKPKERDSLFAFIFTAIILLIFVFGSLWIMHDLNYFMMDPIMKELGHQH